MSTLFTTSEAVAPLTVLLHEAGQGVMSALTAKLSPVFPGIGPVELTFFGALDCGATHAAGVAARLGISRQAVSRTARDLEAKGFLHICPDQDRMNHNLLVMTELGEALARDGRAALAEIEAQIGDEDAKALRRALAALKQQPAPGKTAVPST